MQKPKTTWLDGEERAKQLDHTPAGEETAYFGYDRILADKKTDQVTQHFNSVARHYDFMNTLLSFGIHHLWKRTAVKMMELVPGDNVVDVCGGTGDLAILAARVIGPSGQVTIFDINRAMIQAGFHKISHTDIEKRIQYVQGNAEDISFPEATFDKAMVGFGIRNVTHMQKGFEEMYRVLKPGGKMMCLEFSKPTAPVFRRLYDFYSFQMMPFIGQFVAGNRKAYMHLPESIRMFPLPDELSDLLKKIGFSHVIYRKLTNGIAVIHLAIK
ncbi:MAG: bifunctional demethylmenaquinone methyltransferase/2-methoxy-6-polyprenyl-1,4-benzoquinol methylase UbiE [Deltaproteobacteria bacterium]|nr:bifunctional demethylmenaquinone methyltransferase/2-methoxy-6-polyprenyl-1,4-benzoquinol methylase UbiE [Deltaproteobacteria bacterium]